MDKKEELKNKILEEYKKGNAQIHPIVFSDFKEIIDDLHELGFDSFVIDVQSFLLKTLY